MRAEICAAVLAASFLGACTLQRAAPILSAGQGAADLPVGAAFRDCAECPDMVRIPGRSFAAGRFEVTFAQWDACVEAGGCNDYSPPDPLQRGRGNRPVTNVSWNDAQAYVQWLSQRTGQGYRLLTSAEWEYIARAGATTNYSWGDQDPVCDRGARNGANFYECHEGTGWGGALPVGSFQPNGFGLYDVHGNVDEWVEDCYEDRCSDRIPDDCWALIEGTEGDCSDRMLRGGTWHHELEELRFASRGGRSPDDRGGFEDFIGLTGFRVARDL